LSHVHLLVTPDRVGSVSRMMQNLGRAYVQIFNSRHRRTGTLWEGRYKSCLVDSESYVLRCYRYIELNPVRAWMVEQPDQHPWSSYAGNAGLRHDPLLMPHPVYTQLGTNVIERSDAYRALFAEVLSDDALAEIRIYLQQQRALGTSDFQRRVEQQLQRFAAARPPHRPRKAG
jgi:putative transposase